MPPRNPLRELHARAYAFWMDRTDPLLALSLDTLYAVTEGLLARYEQP